MVYINIKNVKCQTAESCKTFKIKTTFITDCRNGVLRPEGVLRSNRQVLRNLYSDAVLS